MDAAGGGAHNRHSEAWEERMTGQPDERPRQEARRIAQVRLMRKLLGLLDDGGAERLEEWLRARQFLSDGQEDPGAVMVEGLELELAVAEAFRELAEALQEARQAGR